MTLLTRNICCSKIQQNTNKEDNKKKGDNKKHENYKETKICWI